MYKQAPVRCGTSAVRTAAIVSLLSPLVVAVAVVARFGPTVATSIVAAACICGATAAANWWTGWAYRAGQRDGEMAAFDLAELALLDRHLDEVDPFHER